MKIGLIADTHDKLDAVEKAVKCLNEQEIEHVLHAGDLVSPFVATKFRDLKAKLHIVWGNNEGDRGHVQTMLGKVGAHLLGNLGVLELGGRRIALLHGTSEAVINTFAESRLYDIIVRGHTHEAKITKGRTLIINPGEVCGYLSGRQTLAVLDLLKLKAEIVEL
jgi:hypothetical protein